MVKALTLVATFVATMTAVVAAAVTLYTVTEAGRTESIAALMLVSTAFAVVLLHAARK